MIVSWRHNYTLSQQLALLSVLAEVCRRVEMKGFVVALVVVCAICVSSAPNRSRRKCAPTYTCNNIVIAIRSM